MPDLPKIKALEPTVVPPVEEKTFDEYRLMELHIDAKVVGRPVDCVAILRKGRIKKEDGEWELSAVDAPLTLRWENLLHSAAADTHLGQVVGGLLAYVAAEVERQQTPVVVPEPETTADPADSVP